VTDLRQRLERLVPELHGEGQWDRVLADADRSRARRLSLVLSLAAAAAAAAILALAWPFGSERSGGVLERALAAIGEGPVLHVVYRGEESPVRVGLVTGEVAAVVSETEVWYDPQRGVNYISRLDGKVHSEHLVPQRDLSARQIEHFVALARNYRSALDAGTARVIGPGRVGDREVVWIRTQSEWYPSQRDAHYHLIAEEVAVDRETFKPLYARTTQDGKPPPRGGGVAITKLERLPSGAGDFEAKDRRSAGDVLMGGSEYGKLVQPGEFRDTIGGAAFWLGASHEGRPLAEAREYIVRRKPVRGAKWETHRGLSLFYGKLRRKGRIPLRALSKGRTVIQQFRGEPPDFWIGAYYARAAPEGSLVIGRPMVGSLVLDGTYLSIEAPTVRDMVGAAAALRPVGAAPARSSLDFDRIARDVEAQRRQRLPVSGGRPVEPRPIARDRGRVLQTGTNKGVTARVFSGGVIELDFRAMDATLRRVAPRLLRWYCLRTRKGALEGAGWGQVSSSGVRSVVPLGHNGRRMVPLRPPFDGCELGTGFGRNWLRRFDFHGMLELPLTAAGRSYFDERAAARELAYFVRSGPRQAARREMRAGRPARPAEQLRDRSRPYIAVVSSGDRFRVTLTAPTGRRFFVEIVRGSIRRTNARELAAAYLR
jgi:hypothetical protein